MAILGMSAFSRIWKLLPAPASQTIFCQNQNRIYHCCSCRSNWVLFQSKIDSSNRFQNVAGQRQSSTGRSTKKDIGKSSLGLNRDDWNIIYRFKHIVPARGIQKLKLYQTIFSCFVVTPLTVALYFQGMVDQAGLTFIFGTSAFACGMLYVMGNIFGRLIGLIYTSESNPSKVKVSRLTFWGNRLDTVYPINDFAPFSDMSINPQDVYFPLQQYSSPEKSMYLSLRYGLIYDVNEFQRVFGDIPASWNIRLRRPGDSNEVAK